MTHDVGDLPAHVELADPIRVVFRFPLVPPVLAVGDRRVLGAYAGDDGEDCDEWEAGHGGIRVGRVRF